MRRLGTPAGELGASRREGVGAAEVDLAAAQVGDERGARVECAPVRGTDELDAVGRRGGDLARFRRAARARRSRRAAARRRRRRRQLLQQREDRRGADAGADEQQAVALGGVGGEGAVGALDRHARPGPQRASPALWSPRSLTVMRSRSPSGAAESEYGCACHHSPRRRKRHCRNWPPATGSRSRLRPRSTTETTPGPSCVDARRRAPGGAGSATPAARCARRRRRRASRPTARSTRPGRRDGRRTTRPWRPGARTTGRARGRCRGAPTTTSRRPSAGARAGRS